MRTFLHQHLPSTTLRDAAGVLLAADAASLWHAVFGNDQNVFVEVGPGRGEFLIRAAHENPTQNYFGIERSRARTREIEGVLAKRGGVPNLRLLNADAACALGLLPDASVAGYYVLFPDPWWKLRHHRRRLLTPEFVATLRRTLVPGGLINLATDVEGYFVVAQECLRADAGLEIVAVDGVSAPSTSFSRKAQRLGTPIYRSVHRRRLAATA